MTKMITTLLFSKVTVKQGLSAALLSLFLLLCGCTNNTLNHPFTRDSDERRIWAQNIQNYHLFTPQTSFFTISDEMRHIVKDKFGQQHKTKAIENLASWLMSDDGHNMSYDLNSNLLPIDAFESKRGNCLSFTILLVNLAKELDIKLDYNDVVLPNIWGFEETQDNFILFRHVNAVRTTNRVFQIFDLAIEEYDFGFPQKIITEQQAAALLNSNIAIQHLNQGKLESALHAIKTAISMDSSNAGSWINLGVIYKNNGQLLEAERALLHALDLNSSNSLAASNLEYLYHQQGQFEKAAYFQKLALKTRQKNPYFHYKLAEDQLQNKQYSIAKKSITKAIKLHDQDPRFFVLSSVIKQHLNKHTSALKDMVKAHQLSVDNEKKQTYSKKAILIAHKIKNAQR